MGSIVGAPESAPEKALSGNPKASKEAVLDSAKIATKNTVKLTSANVSEESVIETVNTSHDITVNVDTLNHLVSAKEHKESGPSEDKVKSKVAYISVT